MLCSLCRYVISCSEDDHQIEKPEAMKNLQNLHSFGFFNKFTHYFVDPYLQKPQDLNVENVSNPNLLQIAFHSWLFGGIIRLFEGALAKYRSIIPRKFREIVSLSAQTWSKGEYFWFRRAHKFARPHLHKI